MDLRVGHVAFGYRILIDDINLLLFFRAIVQSFVEPAQILQSVLWLHSDQNQSAQTAHRERAQGFYQCPAASHACIMCLVFIMWQMNAVYMLSGAPVWSQLLSSGFCQDLQMEWCQFLVNQTVCGEDPSVRSLLCAFTSCDSATRLLSCCQHSPVSFLISLLFSGLSSSFSRSLRKLWLALVFLHW